MVSTHNDYAMVSGDDFTVEFWCKLAAPLTTAQVLISIGDMSIGMGVWTGVETNLFVYLSPSFVTVALPSDVWHHVAFVKASRVFILFLDGVRVQTLKTVVNTYTGSTLYVGGNNNPGGGSGITGYMDDVRVTLGAARYMTDFRVPQHECPTFDHPLTSVSAVSDPTLDGVALEIDTNIPVLWPLAPVASANTLDGVVITQDNINLKPTNFNFSTPYITPVTFVEMFRIMRPATVLTATTAVTTVAWSYVLMLTSTDMSATSEVDTTDAWVGLSTAGLDVGTNIEFVQLQVMRYVTVADCSSSSAIDEMAYPGWMAPANLTSDPTISDVTATVQALVGILRIPLKIQKIEPPPPELLTITIAIFVGEGGSLVLPLQIDKLDQQFGTRTVPLVLSRYEAGTLVVPMLVEVCGFGSLTVPLEIVIEEAHVFSLGFTVQIDRYEVRATPLRIPIQINRFSWNHIFFS
jgi:hypothetical protein